jgi:hypothetical protein
MLIAAVLALLTLPGKAQSQSEFDVASVKPVDISKLGGLISMNIGSERGEEITFDNATLNDCVRFAYGVASNVFTANWTTTQQAPASKALTRLPFKTSIRRRLSIHIARQPSGRRVKHVVPAGIPL